jgi:hypothetical protein
MDFPQPRSSGREAVLALQHIFRVARAMGINPSTGFEGGIAYIVDEKDVQIVAETWKAAFEEPPELLLAVVKGLPRGAKVEWHIIRCQKPDDDDDSTRTKFRMVYSETMARATFSDFGPGLLCFVLGEYIALQRSGAAIQWIPSQAIYSVSRQEIQQHRSCIIILAD